MPSKDPNKRHRGRRVAFFVPQAQFDRIMRFCDEHKRGTLRTQNVRAMPLTTFFLEAANLKLGTGDEPEPR